MSLSGGKTSSNQSAQNQSTSGFQALSPQIQNTFNTLATDAQGYLDNPNSLTSMATPIGQTAGETSAINTINNNNPLTDLSSNISAQMDPYISSVINQVKQQALGQNSILNQNLNAAGQFGSNRAALGANDISDAQANTLGGLLSNQYGTALNNALTTIPADNLANASAQLQGGAFQRQLGLQTAQAPLTGLASIAQILGILPTNSGQSTGSSSGSSSGFNFGIGNLI